MLPARVRPEEIQANPLHDDCADQRTEHHAEKLEGRTDDGADKGLLALLLLLCKRLANTPPRFFQLAAWCPPVFGGH
ncbi:hypothetical protein, partial [Pseudomonas aeruginosa]|uniref:hypothetical protein n=1 Tax=Pseudomonas aeruginosa TaxID=287 RepID=UPI00319E372C